MFWKVSLKVVNVNKDKNDFGIYIYILQENSVCLNYTKVNHH